MIGTIDEIRIEGEENGFHLVIFTDDGETHRYRIGLPDQFRTETDRTIGAWLAEGEAARDSDDREGWATDAERDAGTFYLDDPRHPDYHDTMSGLYDNREGK